MKVVTPIILVILLQFLSCQTLKLTFNSIQEQLSSEPEFVYQRSESSSLFGSSAERRLLNHDFRSVLEETEGCASSNWSWENIKHEGPHHESGDIRSVKVCASQDKPNTLYFENLPGNPCNNPKGPVAEAVLKNGVNQTGWAYLDVKTNGNFSNKLIAYAAGLAEAAVSVDLISYHMHNIGYKDCISPTHMKMKEFCTRMDTFLAQNMNYMLSMADEKTDDPYWQHVKLALYQLSGLDDAYTLLYRERFSSYRAVNLNTFEPNIKRSPALLWMQLVGDLDDLEQALGKPKKLWIRPEGIGHCSAFIKPVNKNSDLLMSHNSWITFESMMRIIKRVSLQFVNNGAKNPGHTISFSSYAGKLASYDDFYITSAKLVVSETTIPNYNTSLWTHVNPNTLLTWIRALVANKLASNPHQWVELFKLQNSGTYNNQWMVVDYKKFKAGKPLPDSGLFYILEQLPGIVHFEDMTKTLKKQGYWSSYNVPYFKSLYEISNLTSMVERYGDYYTYEKTSRAQIFKRDWGSVKDMKTLTKLMRYNDFQNDPLSRCNCTPPYSGINAIAARNDLNQIDGTYPFAALAFRDHGAIDMKAVNMSMVNSQNILAVSGPTCDQQPIFVWSEVAFGAEKQHVGQPDRWNFPFVIVDWLKNN